MMNVDWCCKPKTHCQLPAAQHLVPGPSRLDSSIHTRHTCLGTNAGTRGMQTIATIGVFKVYTQTTTWRSCEPVRQPV